MSTPNFVTSVHVVASLICVYCMLILQPHMHNYDLLLVGGGGGGGGGVQVGRERERKLALPP